MIPLISPYFGSEYKYVPLSENVKSADSEYFIGGLAYTPLLVPSLFTTMLCEYSESELSQVILVPATIVISSGMSCFKFCEVVSIDCTPLGTAMTRVFTSASN